MIHKIIQYIINPPGKITVIQYVILILCVLYIAFASVNIYRRRNQIKAEKGTIPLYGLISALAMFFGSFGVSDTAISMFGYRKKSFGMKFCPAPLSPLLSLQ